MHLLAARVLHFDETGMRCEKKPYWVHVASSELATLYTIHPNRGQKAMNEADILPRFQGIGVHDHWFPYFSDWGTWHAWPTHQSPYAWDGFSRGVHVCTNGLISDH